MASLACTMGTVLLLGFSQSLAWAIVARALGGAANGNVGIIRTTGKYFFVCGNGFRKEC